MVGGGSENETRNSVHLHCKKIKNIQEKKRTKRQVADGYLRRCQSDPPKNLL